MGCFAVMVRSSSTSIDYPHGQARYMPYGRRKDLRAFVTVTTKACPHRQSPRPRQVDRLVSAVPAARSAAVLCGRNCCRRRHPQLRGSRLRQIKRSSSLLHGGNTMDANEILKKVLADQDLADDSDELKIFKSTARTSRSSCATISQYIAHDPITLGRRRRQSSTARPTISGHRRFRRGRRHESLAIR